MSIIPKAYNLKPARNNPQIKRCTCSVQSWHDYPGDFWSLLCLSACLVHAFLGRRSGRACCDPCWRRWRHDLQCRHLRHRHLRPRPSRTGCRVRSRCQNSRFHRCRSLEICGLDLVFLKMKIWRDFAISLVFIEAIIILGSSINLFLCELFKINI